MSMIAVFIGACAAASAVYMILDLSSPYSGIFRASPAPLQQVLAVMGKEWSEDHALASVLRRHPAA